VNLTPPVNFPFVVEIFAEREDGKFWTLKTDLISPRGHPSVAGYKQWESAVIEKATKLLKDISV
jgi:hypothetical protein